MIGPSRSGAASQTANPSHRPRRVASLESSTLMAMSTAMNSSANSQGWDPRSPTPPNTKAASGGYCHIGSADGTRPSARPAPQPE